MLRPRTALFFQDGNFVGREYFARLGASGWSPDLVVAVGAMNPASIQFERERTAGRWNPPTIPAHIEVHRFDQLQNPELAALVSDARIDVAIQAGVGLLKQPLLSIPRFGFVNVHPGRLPTYRGSSCPEWAIIEDQPVVATAHLVDEGLDTGAVLLSRMMVVSLEWDYYDFRSNLYAHCASVLCEVLELVADCEPQRRRLLAVPQPSEGSRRLGRMPPGEMTKVHAEFAGWARRRAHRDH